jgi:cytochrome P450
MVQTSQTDLASPQFKADPFPYYAYLRREAPVFRTKLRIVRKCEVVLVTRYDDVLQVLTDRRFANDWSVRMPRIPSQLKPSMAHMLNRDNPDHSRLRGLVQKTFSPRAVAVLQNRIQLACDELLDVGFRGTEFELVRGYASALPLMIISELLGIPGRDRLRVQSWTKSVISNLNSSTADILGTAPTLWMCVRYLRRLFRRRHSRPEGDLVTALVEAQQGPGALSEDEVLGMVVLLLIAGYEC